jgi:gluconate 2-dehydrogenase gamma chain
MNQYNSGFTDCNLQQPTAPINEIVYPVKAKPAMQPGMAFFNKRNKNKK